MKYLKMNLKVFKTEHEYEYGLNRIMHIPTDVLMQEYYL